MQMCMKSQAASSLESELMNQGFPFPLPCKDTAVKGMNGLWFCSQSVLSFGSSLKLGSMKQLCEMHQSCP